MQTGQTVKGASVWPRVRLDDWCGEYSVDDPGVYGEVGPMGLLVRRDRRGTRVPQEQLVLGVLLVLLVVLVLLVLLER